MSSSAAVAVQASEIHPAPASATIEIGGTAIRFCPDRTGFADAIVPRYAAFLNNQARPRYEFEVSLRTAAAPADAEPRLSRSGSIWSIERGDLQADWDVRSHRGHARQEFSAYSTDALLRIVHTLLLVEEGGFLLHASSVARNGRAFLFAGISGAGKTTISRLAPRGAILLSDEISYVRAGKNGYCAHGTPFTSFDLQPRAENISAPLGGVYLLEKGPENRIDAVDESTAARSLLRNVLFFTKDAGFVNHLFEAALEFVSRIPVRKLIFTPEERVWDVIR